MKRVHAAGIVVSFLAACAQGTVSPEAESRPGEPSAAEEPASATMPTAPCDVTRPFGQPTLVAQLSGPDEDLYPRLSADGLVVYLLRTKAGDPNGTFYTARRASRSAPFSPPVASSLTGARAVSFTADGLTMVTDVFESNRRSIQVARRKSPNDVFDAFTKVNELFGPGDDAEPFLVPDGSTIYFSTWRGADTSWSIMVAERASTGGFGPPASLAAINRAGSHEVWPLPSADGLTLYFGSDRPGGYGRWDIWMSTRASKNDSFGEPKLVPELASSSDDVPSWLSADGCEMLLSSNRGAASYDVYSARRP